MPTFITWSEKCIGLNSIWSILRSKVSNMLIWASSFLHCILGILHPLCSISFVLILSISVHHLSMELLTSIIFRHPLSPIRTLTHMPHMVSTYFEMVGLSAQCGIPTRGTPLTTASNVEFHPQWVTKQPTCMFMNLDIKCCHICLLCKTFLCSCP